MRFQNEIEVVGAPEELFAFLTDVERVAPCLPGAAIDGRDGDAYKGSMKVKVGPITGTYKGTMRFLERDENALRAVMSARAAEVSGQGDAEAKITTEIEPAEGGGASRIRMDTDLQMRGRVAQFGRGAMEKISQRMFEEFARNLEQEMRRGGGNGAAPSKDGEPGEDEAQSGGALERRGEPQEPARSEPTPRAQRPVEQSEGQALDALSMFVLPALQRAAPYVGSALVAFGYGYLLGRLRERR